MVGRIGGKQDLSLGKGCTNVDSTIQHEFMHALGFYHEQSRPDRDNHIFIDFDRTEEDCKLSTHHYIYVFMRYVSNIVDIICRLQSIHEMSSMCHCHTIQCIQYYAL